MFTLFQRISCADMELLWFSKAQQCTLGVQVAFSDAVLVAFTHGMLESLL